MKIEIKDVSPVKKTLSVEAGVEEVERETEEVVRRYAQKAKIPGFRAGKVPIPVIRTRFAREIKEDVRDRLLTRLYAEATREKGLTPLGNPDLEEVSFEADAPFRFRTTFEVRPELEPRNYRGIEVRVPPVAVAENEIEQALEDLRKNQVRLVTEPERAASTGDVVVADVEGEPEGGEPFRKEGVMIETGATGNLPAFNEGILGATAGSTREFSVSYPKEYDAPHLAGKLVRYRLAIHEVKRAEYPNVDDEFAKDLGDFESLTALRERIRSDLGARKEAQAKEAVRQRLLEKVLLENPIPLPDVLVQEEIQHRLEDFVRSMMMQGLDPRQLEVDWKQIRAGQEEPARKSVHARLVLDSIAAANSVDAPEQEVEARIRVEAARGGQDARDLRKRLEQGGGLEALKNQLVREKTLDFLTSVANIHREG